MKMMMEAVRSGRAAMTMEKNILYTRGVNFFPLVPESVSIEQGLDFMLGHFQEPLFPRKVSTIATEDRQYPVYSKNRALLYYRAAIMRRDCKLAVYPDYDKLIESSCLPPTYRPRASHLFIDLDIKSFADDQASFELALKTTLENIRLNLNGAIPTVVLTGGGCHIHQPLDPDVIPVFEELPEFARFSDPSTQFLRYAARRLTDDSSDPSHSISFSSCMARVPGSINSKYESADAEIKILQKWNGIRARPTKRFMLVDFLLALTQKTIDQDIKRVQRRHTIQKRRIVNKVDDSAIDWIDKLLSNGVADGRKRLIYWVLAPYLITVRGLDYDKAYTVLEEWLDKCDRLRRLQPSWNFFEYRIDYCLDLSEEKSMKPSGFDALQAKSPDIYQALKLGGGAQY
jgi:hypothetical protein